MLYMKMQDSELIMRSSENVKCEVSVEDPKNDHKRPFRVGAGPEKYILSMRPWGGRKGQRKLWQYINYALRENQ